MSAVDAKSPPGGSPRSEPADLRLEAFVIPVADAVTDRLPGRLDPTTTSFNSAGDLAAALHYAESADAEHEKHIGRAVSDWPGWYAEYMVREQSGQELPQ